MIDQLSDQHRDLLNLFDELGVRVSASTLEDSEGLSRCRWRLHRVLTQHLALEDEHIYKRLALEPRTTRVKALLRGRAEAAALVDVYRAHFKHWSLDAVGADWLSYRAAVDSLIEQARSRIAWEDQNLYPAIRASLSDGPILRSA